MSTRQISVAEGTMKPRTSGLSLSLARTWTFIEAHTLSTNRPTRTVTCKGPKQGPVLPLSHCVLVSSASDANTHVVGLNYTRL